MARRRLWKQCLRSNHTCVHKHIHTVSLSLSQICYLLHIGQLLLAFIICPGEWFFLWKNVGLPEDHIETPRPVSSRVRLSDSLPEPEPPQNPDPLVSVTTNGGMRYEIQTLEDHMKNAHPRLAKWVTSPNFTTTHPPIYWRIPDDCCIEMLGFLHQLLLLLPWFNTL
jgi:hypothetical protein